MSPFELLDSPVWVFDISEQKMWWANSKALHLWNSSDLEELTGRDFATDMSEATHLRLKNYQEQFSKGKSVQDVWTFYPKGEEAVTVTCHCTGISIGKGNMGVLIQARPYEDPTQIERRAIEALHHTNAIVSMFDFTGLSLYENPMALGTFGGSKERGLWARFVDERVAHRGRQVIRKGEVFSVETKLRTLKGERWFGVDLRLTKDPIDGSEAILLNARYIHDLKNAEEMLAIISRAQSDFIGTSRKVDFFDGFLSTFIGLTESEYGFIGEILKTEKGKPYLRTYAISNIAWNEETRKTFNENSAKGFEFFNLETLFGEVIKTEEPVIANHPRTDPRSGGLPEGHPALESFLGLPFIQGGRIVGMIGLANRPGGYDQVTLDFLEPLVATATNLINATHAEEMLIKAKADAEHANETKSRFLANMSHEIRTPMNGVLGMTEILLDSDVEEKHRVCLEAIQTSGSTLMAILNDILDLSKIEAGMLAVENIPFEIAKVVFEVGALLEPKAAPKDLRLICRTSPEVPKVVLGDPTRIRQILWNLMGNAVKFTDQGEVEVGVRVVHKTEGDVRLEFRVSDTGPGIPDKAKKHIFEPFLQADPSTTRKYGGSGLGMTITKELVTQLGGAIWFESVLGQGTHFYFALNFSIGEKAVIGRRASGTPEWKNPPWVLVAEDNIINQRVVTKMLESLGVCAHVVGDGDQVLPALLERSYDLILMDIQMPRVSGIEVTQNLRRNSKYRGLPIIALSASAMEYDRARCLDAGMNDFLAKPIEKKTLLALLKKWVAP